MPCQHSGAAAGPGLQLGHWEASPAPNATGLTTGFCLGLACLHLKVRGQLCHEISLQETHLGREEKTHEAASPQPVPGLQHLLLFLSQSWGAPCIPVEMGLNPPDHKLLPVFAASHKAHTSIGLGQLPF